MMMVMVVIVSASVSTKRHATMIRERITDRVGELFDRCVTLDFILDNPDAPWEYTEEPHVKRRQVLLDHVIYVSPPPPLPLF